MPTVHFFYQRKKVTCRVGETIYEVARQHNIPIFQNLGTVFNCKRLGLCKACRVRVIQTIHVSRKSFLEKIRLMPSPWRQACQARILDDVIVWTQGKFDTILPPGDEDTNYYERQSDRSDLFEVEEITPEAVKHLLDEDQPIVLLDVREMPELEKAKIEGAISIPLSRLNERLDELDKDADIIIHCHHGMRSQTAAEILFSSGFNHIRSMAGGIDGWSLKVDFSIPRY